MADLHYSFDELVENLEDRRRVGEEPPVLLLGAGASAAAGLATMRRLYEAEKIPPDAADAFERFCNRMSRRDDRERFRFLATMLQTADPSEVTPGYRALARLCAQHVFDIVLSANLDPLLEDAFTETALKRRDVLVLINGVLRSERLPLLLMDGAPRVKLVKLHGDLFHRYMAWTPSEMESYLREITPALTKALAMRDVLVVGYSMRDPAVRELALSTGGTVWFAGPSQPSAEVAALLAQAKVRLLIEERCKFETFFPAIAAALGIAPAPAAAAPPAKPTSPAIAAAPPPAAARDAARPALEVAGNLDDVLAATVGIAVAPGGAVSFTGFVLDRPRVIVTDGWNARHIAKKGAIEIVTQAGDRHLCRLLTTFAKNKFGPAILAAPSAFGVSGLHVDPTEPPTGLPVHAAVGTNLRRFIMEGGMSVEDAVAAGMIDEDTGRTIAAALKRQEEGAPAIDWRRFSLSSGTVTDPHPQPILIGGVGHVPSLIELGMATTPGSSGAPVVDANCAVRGFIVAGSSDPKHPVSYALGAPAWAAAVGDFSRPRTSRK